MISYLILCNIKGVFEVENYDFHYNLIKVKTSQLGLFSSLNREISELNGKGHELSRAELKIVQLEPARLGLITNSYSIEPLSILHSKLKFEW